MINSFVTVGFYTPDYSHWLPPLFKSLEAYSIPHDFVEVSKEKCWEANTLQKAKQILLALDRNPSRTLIYLDVDCTIRGDISPLANIKGEIGINLNGRRRHNGNYKLHVTTNVLVIKPGPGSRTFLEAWIAQSAKAQYGDVDQTSFVLAMGECHGTSFQPLQRSWIGTKDNPTAIILHDNASSETRKVTQLDRLLHKVVGAKKRAESCSATNR